VRKKIIYFWFDVCTRHEVHRAQAHTVLTQFDNNNHKRFVTALGQYHRITDTQYEYTRSTVYKKAVKFLHKLTQKSKT